MTLETREGTTLVVLPYPLRRAISGGCQCSYCKSHPQKIPMWDTVATDGKTSWTVHCPELGQDRVAKETAKAV